METAEYKNGDHPGEKTKRTKGYAPTDGDWDLSRIGIEEAENGVVISCGYKLKDEIRDKMNKQSAQGVSCGSTYRDDAKHVFETKDAAKKFIIDELNAMWGKD